MKNWESIYNSRLASKEEALSHIQSYQKVFLAPFCNEPQTLVEELINQRNRLYGVSVYNVIIGSPCTYADPSYHKSFNIRSFLGSSLLKGAYKNKMCDYVPVNLSEIPRWISEAGIDVALIQVSPPNEEGFCNLGISVDVVQSLITNAKFIIAQVNNDLPITSGETSVHVSKVHRFVHANRELLTIPHLEPSVKEKSIGNYVAELIPDFATVQVGLGKIANSVMMSLKTKKGLGIHSGSIIDSVMELIELGVITNERKEINTNKTVCTTITGTYNLYQYVNGNQDIELYPANYTHQPAVISQISNFCSVNSAIEVDVFGQINAEQIGQYPVAGVGGQMDFINGAKRSKGGKAIIALPSTAKNGAASRIKLKTSYVTSIKSEIDYVVTEYGIASLFGKSLTERARELISIAHPDFRDALLQELKENYLLI